MKNDQLLFRKVTEGIVCVLGLMLFLLFVPQISAAESTEAILTIPVDSNSEELQYPQSFFITDEHEIYVCDYFSSKIISFKDSKRVKELTVDHNRVLIDLYVDSLGQLYLLDEAYNVIITDAMGNIIEKRVIPKIKDNAITLTSDEFVRTYYFDPEFIRKEDESVIITFSNKREYILTPEGELLPNPGQVIGKLNENNPVIHYNDTDIFIEPAGEIVELFPQKQDMNKRLFVKVTEFYESNLKSIVEETIRVIDQGKITDIIPLRDYSSLRPHRPFRITNEGDVYQMMIEKGQVVIYKLAPLTKEKFQSGILTFKEKLQIVDKAEQALQTIKESETFPLLNKAQAYANAVGFVEYEWVYNSSKNSNLERTSNKEWVEQPDWLLSLNDGEDHIVQGIPYCWGGWSGSKLATEIKIGYYAGNVHSYYYNSKGKKIFHYYVSGTVGMDCSGLICRVYELPKRLSTRSLITAQSANNNEAPFHQIAKSDLSWMDILNDPGNHVMIVDEVYKDGDASVLSYLCIEATRKGDDKVHYQIRPFYEVIGYDAYRYNWFE